MKQYFSLSYSLFSSKSTDIEQLKAEALIALQNYNKNVNDGSDFAISTILTAIGLIVGIFALFATYRSNELSKKANKIAKRQL